MERERKKEKEKEKERKSGRETRQAATAAEVPRIGKKEKKNEPFLQFALVRA